jgi:hypothetical protein
MSEKSSRLARFAHNVLLAAYAALTIWWWLRCDWAFGKSPPRVEAPLLPAAVFGALMLTIWGAAAYLRGLLALGSPQKWLIGFALWPTFVSVLLLIYSITFGPINLSDVPDIMAIPIVATAILCTAFYTPSIGLVRTLPALRIRAASTFFDPALAALIGIIYLAVSVICYSLGRRRQYKLKEPAPPNEPPKETAPLDIPQE